MARLFFSEILSASLDDLHSRVFVSRPSPISSDSREGMLRHIVSEFIEQVKSYNSIHANVRLSQAGILPDASELRELDGTLALRSSDR